jgi:hypothetical protein
LSASCFLAKQINCDKVTQKKQAEQICRLEKERNVTREKKEERKNGGKVPSCDEMGRKGKRAEINPPA